MIWSCSAGVSGLYFTYFALENMHVDLVCFFVVSNYIQVKLLNVFTYPVLGFNLPAVEVRAWMSNYTPYKTVDVITYPCPNLCVHCLLKYSL